MNQNLSAAQFASALGIGPMGSYGQPDPAPSMPYSMSSGAAASLPGGSY